MTRHPSTEIQLPASIVQKRFGVMGCCVADLDFVEHCAASAEIGASYVEAFAFKLQEQAIDAATAGAALKQHNQELLLVIADHIDLENPEQWLQKLEQNIAHWKACGLQRFVTVRAGRSDQQALFMEYLAKAADLIRAAGLIPLSQNHSGGMIESPSELAACKQAGVGIHFDTQQFYNVGHDPIAAWNTLAEDVIHVHIADRDQNKSPIRFGEGVIGIDRLLRRMHASGYAGAITLEPELGTGRDAIPHIKHALDYCHDVMSPIDACGIHGAGHSVYHADDAHKIHTDWGSLHWLSNDSIVKGSEQTVGFVTIKPGCSNPAHQHPDDHEVIIIQAGTCRHFCDDHEVRLRKGDVLHLQPGQAHYAINDGDVDCEMIVLYPTGARSFEKTTRYEQAVSV